MQQSESPRAEKPKILFVIPPTSEHDLYTETIDIDSKKREIRVYPYLGVCYLIAGLESGGYDVSMIDSPAEGLNFKELIARINETKPDIIGLTVNTFTLRNTHLVINACRKEIPSAKIILGGVHLNHSPQDFQYFNADYGLRGDCEFTIKELVEAILKGTDVEGIKGIIYRKSGRVIISEAAVINDLDSIKFPDRARLKPERYVFPLFNRKFTTLVSTRGCPFKCIYCGIPYSRQHRKRSIEDVIKEMKIIESQGFEFVSFSDDIFTFDRERAIELCKEIKKSTSLKWGCATRADRVDYELLKIMKDAGCIDIRYGIESGNERVRRMVIGKNISNEQIEKAIRWAKKMGIVTTGFFLFGQPTETLEEMRETVEFAKKINCDFAWFNIVFIVPNSGTYYQALKEKQITEAVWKDVIEGKRSSPFYCPEGVTLEYMQKLRVQANREFYLRFRYIWDQLRSSRSWGDFVLRARTGINFMIHRASIKKRR